MQAHKQPSAYQKVMNDYPELINVIDEVGKTVRHLGPLSEKHAHLIQIAAAAGVKSQGAVCSHVHRAIEAGASVEEVRHAVLLLTSTLGFPATVAALSWVEEALDSNELLKH